MLKLRLSPRWLLGLLVVAGLALSYLSWNISRGQATAEGPAKEGKAEGKPVEPPLPIKQVVLFNSGVGYFQREGDVEGNARIDLSFPASEINDLLKSLVLQDLGGGKVSTVSYDSHEPIERILRSFAVDLNSNPSLGELLHQVRGELIDVTVSDKEKKETTKLSGKIVGMETRSKTHAMPGASVAEEIELLNLKTEAGIQSVRLEHLMSIKFQSATLESEFQRALQVLARAHD